jgi:uncharacterized repeat protein (TIGR02059 family)
MGRKYKISQTEEYYKTSSDKTFYNVVGDNPFYKVNEKEDFTAPVLQTAITPADGLTIALTYNETLDPGSVPATTDFTITGITRTISNVAVSGAVVTLTVSVAIYEGDSYTLDYTAGTNPIRDEYTNNADDFTNQSVTNNSTVDGDAPVIQSAVIPADGLSITMTYDELLDETSVPVVSDFDIGVISGVVVDSVAVSGLTVLLGLSDTVKEGESPTLGYTAGSNPIQDLFGNNAANLSGYVITNNSTVPGTEAEYQAVYDQFSTKPSEADAEAQNTFVKALVDGGIWSEGDRMFVLASHASGADSVIDWINPTGTSATIVNSPTWTQYQGYVGSSGNYINTNYNPTDDAVNWLQNSATMVIYSRTAKTANSGQYEFGCFGTNRSWINIHRTTNRTRWILNSNSSGDEETTAESEIDGLAMHGYDRAESSLSRMYKRGVEVNKSNSKASTGLPIDDFFVTSVSSGGTPVLPSPAQISLVFLGGSLGATKQLALYNAFQTLMTYYGTQV